MTSICRHLDYYASRFDGASAVKDLIFYDSQLNVLSANTGPLIPSDLPRQRGASDPGIMPNTGQLVGQAWKCDSCRKDFKAVWLPTNVCCRVAVWPLKAGALIQAPYSRHISNELKEASTKTPTSACFENITNNKSGREIKKKPDIPVQCLAEPWTRQVNSLAPFSTLGKYTCGYYFSRATDNKKRKTGIPPSDLVSWRSNIS